MVTTRKPTKPSAAQLPALGLRYREVVAEIKRLTAEKEQLVERLSLLAPDDYALPDGHTLTVGATRTIDTALTQKLFPVADYPDYYKLSFDVTEFRRHVAVVDIEKYEKTSPRVAVK